MFRFTTLSIALALSVGGTLGPGAGRASTAAGPSRPSCDGSWVVEASPSIGDEENVLRDVDALAADDVWAAGWLNDRGRVIRTLIEHRDATGWSVVPSANGGGRMQSNFLLGVHAIASEDVWAVGYRFDPSGEVTLTEHWDGIQWTVVPSPNVGDGTSRLSSVSATSADDVWAVGYYVKGFQYQTLAMHWDGSVWTIVRTPNAPTGDNYLYDVVAITPTDAWAVGFGGTIGVALTLHWDGALWTRVPNPNIPGGPFLGSVDATGSDDVWAVGEVGNFRTLVEHWDGAAWTVVPSPNEHGNDSALTAVAATGPDAAWAVGWSLPPSGGAPSLVERWDGSAWTIVPSPAQGGTNYVFGVTATESEAWLVGETIHGSLPAFRTLVEHEC